MKKTALALALIGAITACHAQSVTEAETMLHVSGTFDVNLIPQPSEEQTGGAMLGRMILDKHYHGGLEASSAGAMLTAMTEVKGSAGYVAIERVSGALNGRNGSFVLQHYGIMAHGGFEQIITVVPDSGTGELTGLSGKLTGKIENGVHYYQLDYNLPR